MRSQRSQKLFRIVFAAFCALCLLWAAFSLAELALDMDPGPKLADKKKELARWTRENGPGNVVLPGLGRDPKAAWAVPAYRDTLIRRISYRPEPSPGGPNPFASTPPPSKPEHPDDPPKPQTPTPREDPGPTATRDPLKGKQKDEPRQKPAPKFRLTDGRTLTGRIVIETDSDVLIRTADGKLLKVARRDLVPQAPPEPGQQ